MQYKNHASASVVLVQRLVSTFVFQNGIGNDCEWCTCSIPLLDQQWLEHILLLSFHDTSSSIVGIDQADAHRPPYPHDATYHGAKNSTSHTSSLCSTVDLKFEGFKTLTSDLGPYRASEDDTKSASAVNSHKSRAPMVRADVSRWVDAVLSHVAEVSIVSMDSVFGLSTNFNWMPQCVFARSKHRNWRLIGSSWGADTAQENDLR